MADPTNINVPPAKAADPTNINVPVHGTKFPSGVVGSDVVITLRQGSDLGNGVTGSIADQYIAPCRLYLRKAVQSNFALAATCSFKLANTTQSIDVVAAQTPTTNTATAVSFASAAAQIVEEGDVLQLQVTTSGGAGALKGGGFTLFATQLAGTTTSPV